jgi:hypothetical protein
MSKTDYPALLVRELFDYRDGLLYWRERPKAHFSDERSWKIWNSRFSGKEVGHVHKSRSGTRRKTVVTVGGLSTRFLTSRLVWAWHKGKWPENLVDHEDGDTLNDRIGNLRDVPDVVNSHNMRRHKHNKSGVTGVNWHAQRGKWVAGIMAFGVNEYLGIFENLDDAVAARKAAERRLGFHPNHGREAHA